MSPSIFSSPVYPVHGFLPTGPSRAGLRFRTRDSRDYLIDSRGSLRRCTPEGQIIPRQRRSKKQRLALRRARALLTSGHLESAATVPSSLVP